MSSFVQFNKGSTSLETNIEIHFSDDLGNKGQIISNNENSLVLQTHILNPPPKVINVNFKVSGSSLIQVSYKYNINKGEETPRFTIKSEVKKHRLEETFTCLFAQVSFLKEMKKLQAWQ